MGSRPEETWPQRLFQLAREGDGKARNDLIQRFLPFVLRVASRACGRYLSIGTDEEISVALMAFNEAIDAYQDGRGTFLPFAETVIRRRLIDFYRKARSGTEVPFSYLTKEDEEGQDFNPVDVGASFDAWQRENERTSREDEINRYAELLSRFGLRFEDLPEISPRHRDARENAIAAARLLVQETKLYEEFTLRQQLPLKELALRCSVSRKTLERNRRYIIAVALAMSPQFEYLRGYFERSGGWDG